MLRWTGFLLMCVLKQTESTTNNQLTNQKRKILEEKKNSFKKNISTINVCLKCSFVEVCCHWLCWSVVTNQFYVVMSLPVGNVRILITDNNRHFIVCLALRFSLFLPNCVKIFKISSRIRWLTPRKWNFKTLHCIHHPYYIVICHHLH